MTAASGMLLSREETYHILLSSITCKIIVNILYEYESPAKTYSDINNRIAAKKAIVIASVSLLNVTIPKLFSKFISTDYGGTGLGLFISKYIIESHNGKIWTENNIDGRGATFSFSLPISSK